jgi:hypothetical protein
MFEKVERFSFFLAPSRSGHSVVAHLLSAHPDVLMSDELDALMWLDEGFSADQVYALIKYQNYRFAKRGRRKSGYNYRIDESWQYAWDKHPRAIGDSKGRQSAMRLAADPSVVENVRSAVGVPLRVFVQARHPYAVVASEMRRRKWDLTTAVDRVIEEIRSIDSASKQLTDDERLTVYHEDLLSDPKSAYERMFGFLDVEVDPGVVRQCADKTWGRDSTGPPAAKRRSEELDRLDEVMRASPVFLRYLDDPDLRRHNLPVGVSGGYLWKKFLQRISR